MSETEIHPDATAFDTPRHVAIIMDGNGRWAATRGLPRAEGHRRGVEERFYTVSLADSGTDRELLRTAIFRPEAPDAQP